MPKDPPLPPTAAYLRKTRMDLFKADREIGLLISKVGMLFVLPCQLILLGSMTGIGSDNVTYTYGELACLFGSNVFIAITGFGLSYASIQKTLVISMLVFFVTVLFVAVTLLMVFVAWFHQAWG